MKQIIVLIFLTFTMNLTAQSWHSTCADEGYLEIEEVGGITRVWVEGAYFNCYGSPTDKWHEFRIYCHEGQQNQLFKVPFGDTLEVLIGKELVVVAASSRYKRGNFVYGTSCPNVCITGSADVDCFEEYVEPVVPPTPTEPSYIFEAGCITPSEDAAIVWWPLLGPFSVSAVDIKGQEWACIDKGNCFYLVFETGFVSDIVCFF